MDENGKVYSKYSKITLKSCCDKDGYERVSLVCNNVVYLLDRKHRYLIKRFVSFSELERYEVGMVTNLGKYASGNFIYQLEVD